MLLQQLPWLLFGLYAGVLADRLDRRLLVVTVDLLRVGVLVVLGAAIVTDAVSVTVVLAALFLLGTAEVFATAPPATLLPMLVARADLAVGNARLQAGTLTLNQLVGPPVGAALFAAGAAWPFAAQAVLVAAGALLVSRVALPPHRRDRAERAARPARRRRGAALGAALAAGPHPVADDLHLQHHVRRGLVGAGALRLRPARPRRGRATA